MIKRGRENGQSAFRRARMVRGAKERARETGLGNWILQRSEISNVIVPGAWKVHNARATSAHIEVEVPAAPEAIAEAASREAVAASAAGVVVAKS